MCDTGRENDFIRFIETQPVGPKGGWDEKSSASADVIFRIRLAIVHGSDDYRIVAAYLRRMNTLTGGQQSVPESIDVQPAELCDRPWLRSQEALSSYRLAIVASGLFHYRRQILSETSSGCGALLHRATEQLSLRHVHRSHRAQRCRGGWGRL